MYPAIRLNSTSENYDCYKAPASIPDAEDIATMHVRDMRDYINARMAEVLALAKHAERLDHFQKFITIMYLLEENLPGPSDINWEVFAFEGNAQEGGDRKQLRFAYVIDIDHPARRQEAWYANYFHFMDYGTK